MKTVLIVWDNTAESLKYLVMPCGETLFNKLLTCHGEYVNCCDDPELDTWINDFMYSHDGILKYEMSEGPIIGQTFDAIVHMGQQF